jgi:hypothetical protein
LFVLCCVGVGGCGLWCGFVWGCGCVGGGFVMCGCFSNMYTVLWLRFLLNWLRFFLPWLRFFRAFSLSCKANATVKLAKTEHGPHSSTLVVICVVRLLFVLFYVLFVCKCVLPPGDNPTAVNKYINISNQHRMMRWHCIMNWKGCGRKRTWYSLRQYLCVCYGELRINKETSVYFSNETRTGNPSNTSQTCYRWTRLYVDFNAEVRCQYSSLCVVIICKYQNY